MYIMMNELEERQQVFGWFDCIMIKDEFLNLCWHFIIQHENLGNLFSLVDFVPILVIPHTCNQMCIAKILVVTVVHYCSVSMYQKKKRYFCTMEHHVYLEDGPPFLLPKKRKKKKERKKKTNFLVLFILFFLLKII